MKTRSLLMMACLVISGQSLVMAADDTAKPAASGRLVALYEEEILAHDLYVAFGKKYPDVMPFKNIPRSELRHREAMAGVLKDNKIPVPEKSGNGTFASDGLADLYKKLSAQGEKSVVDALMAGALVEESDIADLRKMQKESTSATDKTVFANLETASNNHLRAFVRNVEAKGGSYKAQVLDPADLKSILATKGQGNGGPGKGKNTDKGQGKDQAGCGDCGDCGSPAKGKEADKKPDKAP